MSKFDDDMARGCLPTGEPLDALYGVGWWTEQDEPKPDPVDLYIASIESRITELEAAQARWVMVSERLPKVSGWYLTGLVYFLGSPYSSEVYFDAENIEPRWNNITSDKIYCWLEGVPELPQPPEVKK
jgi:hypothetical protein